MDALRLRPATVEIDLADARPAAALMLAAALSRPLWSRVSGVDGFACPLRSLTGVPCPLCGMTTSVCATVGADVGAALVASPLGPALVAVAVALVTTGRNGRLRLANWWLWAALAGSWAWQLARFA